MNTFYIVPSDNDALHHGILGMKWGVRRYQPYSVVPRGSGKTGKEIGDAKKTASKHQINRYARKLGKYNARINRTLMLQNKNLFDTEKNIKKIKDTDKRLANKVNNRRFYTFAVNSELENQRFFQEVSFDKYYNKLSKKFDKISMDSINKVQQEKYMKKADKYFKEAMNYRLSFDVVSKINDERFKNRR